MNVYNFQEKHAKQYDGIHQEDNQIDLNVNYDSLLKHNKFG